MKNLIIIILSKILNVIFGFVKVKDNYIIFYSSRNRIDGNPKAIYLYMKKNYNNQYKYKYIMNKNTDNNCVSKEDICYYKTLKGYYYIACSKYWVLSDSVTTLLKKKKNQLYLQTFHGHGPVKRGGLEIDAFKNKKEFQSGIMEHVKLWDVYISMCKKDEEHIINSTGYNNHIYRLGIASTDKIVESKKTSKKEILRLKEKYSIPKDKRVILYAPTYREKLLNKENIDIKIDLLRKLKDCVILVRLHPLLNSKIDKRIFENSNFINVCDVPDIVDLYPIVDILISDYSAAIYEFALTDKEILLYPYDYEEYDEFPGYIIDYHKVMPGPICHTEKELYDVLKNEKESFKNYPNRLKKFNKEFNYLNDGKATQRFVENLINKEFDKVLDNREAGKE